jgi:hypothetical protein
MAYDSIAIEALRISQEIIENGIQLGTVPTNEKSRSIRRLEFVSPSVRTVSHAEEDSADLLIFLELDKVRLGGREESRIRCAA